MFPLRFPQIAQVIFQLINFLRGRLLRVTNWHGLSKWLNNSWNRLEQKLFVFLDLSRRFEHSFDWSITSLRSFHFSNIILINNLESFKAILRASRIIFSRSSLILNFTGIFVNIYINLTPMCFLLWLKRSELLSVTSFINSNVVRSYIVNFSCWFTFFNSSRWNLFSFYLHVLTYESNISTSSICISYVLLPSNRASLISGWEKISWLDH